MYARTRDEEEKSLSASEKPAEEYLYKNAYVKKEETYDDIRDGIDVTQPKAEPAPKRKQYRAKVCVNFRLSPVVNRTDNIIGSLKEGEVVEYLGDATDGFIKVAYERKIGYVKKEYLSEV